MTEQEADKLMRRAEQAERCCEVLVGCLEHIAGQFAPITSAVVGKRINDLEKKVQEHGGRIGGLESTARQLKEADDAQDQRLNDAGREFNALRQRVEATASPKPVGSA